MQGTTNNHDQASQEVLRLRQKALEELGAAFGKIEEHRAYIPSNLYNAVAVELNEWLNNDSQWISNPDLLCQIFPILAEYLISNDSSFKEARGEKDDADSLSSQAAAYDS